MLQQHRYTDDGLTDDHNDAVPLPKVADAPKNTARGPLAARLGRYGSAPRSGVGSKGSAGTEASRLSVSLPASRCTASGQLPQDEEARMLRALLDAGFGKNAIARLLGGSKTTAYNRINRALGEK